MADNRIRRIVIVGGGTAGWMAASALVQMLRNSFCKIYLVEAEDIGTVGVGEATIPPILDFNRALQLDENEFIAKTNATFKLGIKFRYWSRLNHEYFHPFGKYGTKFDAVHFHQHWLRGKALGITENIAEYSIPTLAAELGRFARPDAISKSIFSDFGYAFHFDAGLYANYLREYAESRGVIRLNRKITDVTLHPDNGFIQSVVFESGDRLEGDFFIDCSGFRGLLIEGALKTGFDDWSHYLPCNRAAVVPSERLDVLPPFTQSTAHQAGWQWRIPLQHRTGNGHVYCSQFCSDDDAIAILLKNVEGKINAEPRVLSFTTGIRKKLWYKNCLALGLASGFMEPLESTSIHLVQSAITKFLHFFPDIHCHSAVVDEFNKQTRTEYERIRDFIVLHYHATTRTDSDFWNHCRTMNIPETLKRKIELYKHCGRIFRTDDELFQDTSWFSVFQGQDIFPEDYDHLADVVSASDLKNNLQRLRALMQQGVAQMPTHDEFLKKYC